MNTRQRRGKVRLKSTQKKRVFSNEERKNLGKARAQNQAGESVIVAVKGGIKKYSPTRLRLISKIEKRKSHGGVKTTAMVISSVAQWI